MSLRGRAVIVGSGELQPTRYTEGETTLGMMTKAWDLNKGAWARVEDRFSCIRPAHEGHDGEGRP